MNGPFRKMLSAKIHRATVTGADVNYEGSITIPPELLEAAGGEGFAGEGGEHGTLNDGLAKGGGAVGAGALGGEVTGHGTEEGVAGTGGIGDGFEWPGAAAEDFAIG